MKSKKIFKNAKRVMAVALSVVIFLLSACSSDEQGMSETAENTTEATMTSLQDYIQELPDLESSSQPTEISSSDVSEVTQNSDSTVTEGATQKPSQNSNSTSKKVYETLKAELQAEIDKKDFSDVACKYLMMAFDGLYENYDIWADLRAGMPSKEKYIRTNLIDVIKDITTLDFLNEESKEGQEWLDSGHALGQTTSSFEVTIVYSENDGNEDEIICLLHEIRHVKQKKIVFNYEYFEGYEYLEQFLTEGDATDKSYYAGKAYAYKRAFDFFSNGNRTLNYGSFSGYGYPLHYIVYADLLYLVGFDVMERVCNGESPPAVIKETIAREYGEKSANEFFKALENMGSAEQSHTIFNNGVIFQKEFLKCVEKDISNLKTKNEVISFTNRYRFLKMNGLAIFKENEKDKTNEFFDIYSLDEKLTQKIISTKAFSFSNKDEENRGAIRCLLFTTDEDFLGYENANDFIQVPVNLKEVEYEYKDKKLLLSYADRNLNFEIKEVTLEMSFSDGKVVAKETDEICKNLKPLM